MRTAISPWHADAIGAGRAQHDRRGKMKNRPGGVYSRPSDSSFSLPRGWPGPLPVFIQLTFTSHTAFFDSFLVRPALLPYSKRGFRAAIYKIARPQPPAAAL